MSKPIVIGEYETPELADSAVKVMQAMSPLLGNRKLNVEIKPRYQLLASTGNGLVAEKHLTATDKSTRFECRFHDGRTFSSVQARATHYTRMHSKKAKKK